MLGRFDYARWCIMHSRSMQSITTYDGIIRQRITVGYMYENI